jgi:hypothetical protein
VLILFLFQQSSKVRIEEYEDESVEMIENLRDDDAADLKPAVDLSRPGSRSPDKQQQQLNKSPKSADRSASRSPEKSTKSPVKSKGK